ncbi:2Fe-2S iron-sulfur cluster binding domain-containing protein [Peredibacter starrii]|uniref:2Fe-2S iron-sulfur cluster binding domain-containing protein n=1 Tax=Peredibacter starrii TaxID=28202 RepID=A0AAX4HNN2_9BACT|nr:2Fe-2S iron-sulfur cluster binding domain-containing protein [Peredibacter starrii]WPU64948.1 2Fe-2S iron-sulfur cluster binding domain-containing protein [Peredibacter starrii]
MATLTYKDRSFQGQESETILDCLIRNGEKIPHSCKSGICQSCVMKTNDPVDLVSQKGLKPTKKEAGLFYTCQQSLNKDFEVFDSHESGPPIDGEIISQQRVSSSVVILKIQLDSPLEYKAGQFVNVFRTDQLCRSYSLASVSNNQIIELHVRKVPEGSMSNWLYDSNLLGQKITLSGPVGECYLTQDMENDDLLLIGVGTGLAPLYGIVHEAIANGFKGKITLFHGGLRLESLYLVEELKNLEQTHSQFNYFPVYLLGESKEGFLQGDLVELLKKHEFDLKNTTVMVCGDPDMVKKLKQTVFLKGVSSKKIFSDAFVSNKKV